MKNQSLGILLRITRRSDNTPFDNSLPIKKTFKAKYNGQRQTDRSINDEISLELRNNPDADETRYDLTAAYPKLGNT